MSTQDLSQVIMRATGAANTFGVSMESMIGHATAIGEVTRESGEFYFAPYISNDISVSRICWETLRAFTSSQYWKRYLTSKNVEDWVISRDSPKSYEIWEALNDYQWTPLV